MNSHFAKSSLLLLIVAFSTPYAFAKQALRIVSLSYSGKCIAADTIVTINLNKKITRGFSLIAISSKEMHHHPKIVKWPFRSSSIKVLLPPRSILKHNKNYKISIERRLKHKTLSNKKTFRICRK